MQEYWCNVYIEDGEAIVGARWLTPVEADRSGKGRDTTRSYRIHVKIKDKVFTK